MPHLPRCLASVADQVGVEAEHVVRDGASADGTVEWLKAHPGVQFVSEPDAGMYDALNKGFAAATGDIFSWLNADEQYLPGALAAVAGWFASHPEHDLLFGDFLMVDSGGRLLSYRRAMPMRRAFLGASYLYNFSCAMFFRAGLWETTGGFNPGYRIAGDEDFMLRALSAGARPAVYPHPIAAFEFGGENLTSRTEAVREHERIQAGQPSLIRRARIPLNLLRLAEKGLRGGWRVPGPLEYALYVGSAETRTAFRVQRVPTRWPGYAWPYFCHYRRNTTDSATKPPSK